MLGVLHCKTAVLDRYLLLQVLCKSVGFSGQVGVPVSPSKVVVDRSEQELCIQNLRIGIVACVPRCVVNFFEDLPGFSRIISAQPATLLP